MKVGAGGSAKMFERAGEKCAFAVILSILPYAYAYYSSL
jgi:hypothetical protein